jgi:hypothetical protein
MSHQAADREYHEILQTILSEKVEAHLVATGDNANYTEQGELKTSQESIAKNRHQSETGLCITTTKTNSEVSILRELTQICPWLFYANSN